MIALVLAGVLAALSPPQTSAPTPYEMGRAAFTAGMCASLGWDTSREQVVAFAEAYDLRFPTDDPSARQTEITRGITDARHEVEALTASWRETGDVATFKANLAQRCDALTRQIPELLARSPDTQTAFDAAIQQIVGEQRTQSH